MKSVKEFRAQDTILRAEFAKLIVTYREKTFSGAALMSGKVGGCEEFQDLSKISLDLQNYSKKACQYGLMGVQSDGTHAQTLFHPTHKITHAEVATILSRMLWGNTYQGTPKYWYQNHLFALQKQGIIAKSIAPREKALRGRAFARFMQIFQVFKL